MNYSSLDRIEITEKEIKNLMEWKDKNKDLVRNRKDVLKEGLIVLDKTSIYFKRELSSMEYRYFAQKIKVFSFKYNLLTYQIFNIWIDSDFNKNFFKLDESNKQRMMEDIITIHASIMAYMEHYNPQIEVKYIQSNSSNSKKKNKKKSNNKKVINLKSKVYKFVMVDKPLPMQNNTHKEFERHTISWNVRGHWREYKKTGKKVWVNSYVKGNKDLVKGKTYKI